MAKIVSNEEFIKQAKAKMNANLVLLGDYVNAKTKIPVRCKKCGNNWDMLPSNIKKGQGCKKCLSQNNKKTNEQFKEELFQLWGSRYTPLEKYKGSSVKILCLCNRCNREWKVRPDAILAKDRPRGCPFCKADSTRKRCVKGIDVFEFEIGEDFSVLSDYINARTKIKILHKECGRSFWCTPDNFLKTKCCTACKQSFGEKKVKDFLLRHHFIFEEQKRFKDCRDKRALPFDFYLPKQNIVIEYDGIQHFEKVDFFEGPYGFEYTQRHDNIKNNYCKEKNIWLIRVSYKENVDTKLERLLL